LVPEFKDNSQRNQKGHESINHGRLSKAAMSDPDFLKIEIALNASTIPYKLKPKSEILVN